MDLKVCRLKFYVLFFRAPEDIRCATEILMKFHFIRLKYLRSILEKYLIITYCNLINDILTVKVIYCKFYKVLVFMRKG